MFHPASDTAMYLSCQSYLDNSISLQVWLRSHLRCEFPCEPQYSTTPLNTRQRPIKMNKVVEISGEGTPLKDMHPHVAHNRCTHTLGHKSQFIVPRSHLSNVRNQLNLSFVNTIHIVIMQPLLLTASPKIS